ncbi:hypothetical protein AMTR_s00026p00144200 [Amborella trichopoda]|uniref:Uncharacterized protein n=1 Tax=Amborella trichopoda TaxID=13333 RepID=W1PRD5_AMBTC|nr:hypothetical protein AMTR_s00026p00144200 [Amborella trichopoda]
MRQLVRAHEKHSLDGNLSDGDAALPLSHLNFMNMCVETHPNHGETVVVDVNQLEAIVAAAGLTEVMVDVADVPRYPNNVVSIDTEARINAIVDVKHVAIGVSIIKDATNMNSKYELCRGCC